MIQGKKIEILSAALFWKRFDFPSETITKANDIKGGSVKLLNENVTVEGEKPLDKPKISFLLSLGKPNLEAQFNKFVNILKKNCINIPFAEALSRMPLYAKFLSKIFSKKKTIEHNETIR